MKKARAWENELMLLMFTVLGCPEVLAPNGSYVSNGTLTSRTFLCKSGSVFSDSMERKRTLECKNGKWNETTTKLPGCVGKNFPHKSIMLYCTLYFWLFTSCFIYFIHRLYILLYFHFTCDLTYFSLFYSAQIFTT